MTYSPTITLYNQIFNVEENGTQNRQNFIQVELAKIYIYIYFEKKYKSIIAVKSPRPASPKKSQFSESGSAVTKKQDSIIAVDLSL